MKIRHGTPGASRLPQLRNQQTSQAVNLSLADFVAPVDGDAPDCVGLYALTLGDGLETWITRCREEGSESRAKLAELLAGRLCEAFAEELHRYARIHLWGIEQAGQLSTEELLAGDYPGIRPAFGIPSCPDRSYPGDRLQVARCASRDRYAPERKFRHGTCSRCLRFDLCIRRSSEFFRRTDRCGATGNVRAAQEHAGRAVAQTDPSIYSVLRNRL